MSLLFAISLLFQYISEQEVCLLCECRLKSTSSHQFSPQTQQNNAQYLIHMEDSSYRTAESEGTAKYDAFKLVHLVFFSNILTCGAQRTLGTCSVNLRFFEL